MLSKAVRNYEPPPGKREKAAVLALTSSPATTIDTMLKASAQPSQKSLGGFTKYHNRSVTPQASFAQSSVRSKSVLTDHASNPLKRTSSEMSGFAAALENADAFKDAANVIDLTQENGPSSKSTSATLSAFEFDPNDFDDDSDLDLDMEYPQALPPLDAPREPLRPATMNAPQISTSNSLLKGVAAGFHQLPSSAPTWSSSPPSHKMTPPGALLRRQAEVPTKSPTQLISSEASIDAYPRPAKRRTVPWLQRQAEEERRLREAATNQESEYNETQNQRGIGEEFTPLPKDKSLPWNTTASAMKERQKALKNTQKKVKVNEMSLADMQDVIRTTHQSRSLSITLSEEQNKVLDLVVNKGRSVFFTGSAGTGKSVLMRSIITDLRRKYIREPDRVAVTASTGLAACNIGGVTLHSFSGIGIGKEPAPELVKKINRNQKAKQRWLRTKVLIIDEISMVDGELFDKLETIARTVRKNGRTFGGIQLVVTGDFFQLPPVPDFKGKEVKFAFDAGTWSTAINHTIGLTEVFRQRDPVFANMLNEMRLGKISDETVKAFRRLARPITSEDAIEATALFPTRHEVENANGFKMRNLDGKSYEFKAEDGGTIKDLAARDKLLANFMAPPLLTLKKGAQVMLIKNIDDNLVNGSLGRVVAFMSEKTFDIYDENGDILEECREDEIERSKAFSESMNKLKSKITKDVVGDTAKLYPLVRFTIQDGTTRDLLCQPEDWKIELPNGEIQAQRRQLPLILAWALSIHKAQGQTLPRVTVDLSKVFEKGQAYVALSRATCQEGLQVKGFDKNKVMAHPRVGEFYNSLYSVNAALKHPKVAKGPTKQGAEYHNDLLQGRNDAFVFDDEEEAMAAYG